MNENLQKLRTLQRSAARRIFDKAHLIFRTCDSYDDAMQATRFVMQELEVIEDAIIALRAVSYVIFAGGEGTDDDHR